MSSKKTVFVDTNVFIYFFEGHPVYGPKARVLFEKLSQNNLKALTSLITQTEFLATTLNEQEAKTLLGLFLQTPNLTLPTLNGEVATQAARIRRQYKVRLPDALQLATALVHKADQFITNDKKLKVFKEVKVVMLGD